MKENFSQTDIKEQLGRILSVPAFRNSRILSGFLEFIVQEKLAGKEGEIKEYSIGVNVLSRNNDFNPQLDAIVRIHAGRLRRALKEYYFESGRKDPIRIEIPKGSYVPTFERQDGKQEPPLAERKNHFRSKTTIAVLPFRNISRDSSRDFFADGLGEQLSTELTWFHDLAVISYYSSRHVASISGDLKEAGLLLGAHYLLTGSIQSDDNHLRVSVQLISSENSEQLWSKSFERNNTASDLYDIQNQVVRYILTEIGGYYGAITRDLLKEPRYNDGNNIETYDAIFWYYHYQKIFTAEVYEKTITSLEAAVKADPEYALAWAMLGELYLDDNALAFRKFHATADEALKCALRAVRIDPNCQHAYMALAWIYLFHQNKAEVLKAAEKCLSINPNSSDMTGTIGFSLICAGEFDRGVELLSDSMLHNPYSPWWFKAGFVLNHFHKKEYQQALKWSEDINKPEIFWDALLNASALGHLNRKAEARKKLDDLEKLIPDAGSQVKNIIESFLLSPEVNKEILEGLSLAGLKSTVTP